MAATPGGRRSEFPIRESSGEPSTILLERRRSGRRPTRSFRAGQRKCRQIAAEVEEQHGGWPGAFAEAKSEKE